MTDPEQQLLPCPFCGAPATGRGFSPSTSGGEGFTEYECLRAIFDGGAVAQVGDCPGVPRPQCATCGAEAAPGNLMPFGADGYFRCPEHGLPVEGDRA